MYGTMDSMYSERDSSSIYKKTTVLLVLHYFIMVCHTWTCLSREFSLWHYLILEQLSHLSDLHTSILEIQKEVWEWITRQKEKKTAESEHHFNSEHFSLVTSKSRRRLLQQPPALPLSGMETGFLRLSEVRQ